MAPKKKEEGENDVGLMATFLPPGWKRVEKIYQSGLYVGQTYIRYDGPAGQRGVSSMGKVIALAAEADGKDPDAAVIEFKRKYKEKQEEAAMERGKMKGEMREEAIARFQAAHGKLDGATVVALPGWKGESKRLENCGQIVATYYAPDGKEFKLIKDIEAFFGSKMVKGEAVPDIEAARQNLATDENGRVMNVARATVINEPEGAEESRPKRRKVRTQEPREQDYSENADLRILRVPRKESDLEAAGVDDAENVVQMVEEIQELLTERGFGSKAPELLYITRGKGLLEFLTGVYYCRAGLFNDRPHYQKVILEPSLNIGVACYGIYIFWSAARGAWMIGSLDDSKDQLAFCCEDKPLPAELEKSWSTFDPKLGATQSEGG
mmetsp:Transcript_39771/g.84901  ORF Transcript_39771/g.84901 Transcript_39771/m.84901 type:complete len:380 (+) Transcript_39771:84-1223(+)